MQHENVKTICITATLIAMLYCISWVLVAGISATTVQDIPVFKVHE